jgi:hypothetical protein
VKLLLTLQLAVATSIHGVFFLLFFSYPHVKKNFLLVLRFEFRAGALPFELCLQPFLLGYFEDKVLLFCPGSLDHDPFILHFLPLPHHLFPFLSPLQIPWQQLHFLLELKHS